jgi:hypothetical protein
VRLGGMSFREKREVNESCVGIKYDKIFL